MFTRTASGAFAPTLPWRIFGWTLAALLLLLSVYGWSVADLAALVALLLVAVASVLVGSLTGFLFGIPRSKPQDGDGTQPEWVQHLSESGEVTPVTSYEPNTSLEQISDWLTKLIIGVGLVELRALLTALGQFGERVAAAVGPDVRAVSLVAQTTLVAFFVLGLLGAYLWTRVHFHQLALAVAVRFTAFARS